jgi:tetratricopeptide (TPR) repeat protein
MLEAEMTYDKPAVWRLFFLATVLLLTGSRPHATSGAEEPGKAEPDNAQTRVWSDATGAFKLNAEFIELKSGEVILKGVDGSMLSIALDRLCAADKQYVAAEIAGRPAAEPPAQGAPGNDLAANTQATATPDQLTPKPETRSRQAMLGELYTELNQHGEQVLEIQAKQLAIVEQLQSLVAQCQQIQEQIQAHLAFSAGGSAAGGDRRISLLQSKAKELLQPCANIIKEKQSLESKLSKTIGQGELLGAQFIWLCDPFNRLQLAYDAPVIEALQTGIAAQQGRAPLPFLHLALGFERLRSFEYKDAEAQFLEAQELATDMYPGLGSLCAATRALLLDRRDEIAQSRSLFTATAKSAADPGMVRLFHANALLAHHNDQHAMSELKLGLKTSPKQPLLHEAMARLLATHPKPAMRNSEEAIEHARKACELAKWPTWAFPETLALALASAGDYRGALESLRKALELAPSEAASALQDRIEDYEQKALNGAGRAPQKVGG